MKKILVVMLVAVSLLIFASCEEKPELLEIMPRYVGGSVTEVDHEFTKDDFEVYAIYEGDDTRTIDDYEFEIEKMSGGYFHIRFTFEGMENYCYVQCEYDIFAQSN